MTSYAACRRCHARVIWALNPGGKLIQLDWKPDPQGTFAASCDALGTWTARPETPGVPVLAPEKRYALHWATSAACKRGAETAPQPTENVTQMDDWKKAASAHSRRQRAWRGRRKPPGITGIRIMPRRQP